MISIEKITDAEQYCEQYDVVIFDLDDTLYSEKEYVRSGYRAIAKAVPTIFDMENKLWREFEGKSNAIDEVLRAEGFFSEELKAECLKVYRSHQPQITLYDGVETMLERLIAKGKRLGIVTDGRPEGQRAKIKSLKLQQWIKHIIVTDELGGVSYRKPNSTAFELLQKEFGCPFEKIVYVGDNINKDFMAPQRLGMQSIYFKNKDGLYYKD